MAVKSKELNPSPFNHLFHKEGVYHRKVIGVVLKGKILKQNKEELIRLKIMD